MPINLADAQIGQPLKEGIDYIWRIAAVSAKDSKAGNLLLNVMASVVEGESVGQVASFPAYAFMIYDASGVKTAQWIDQTRGLIARIVGVEKEEIIDLPSHAGDTSESMELLLNSLFEAPANWQPPEGDYAGRWFVGRVIRPVMSDEVAPPDWAEFFEPDKDAALKAIEIAF
jgi:hypothetical protein